MTAHLPPHRSETVFEDFKLPLLHDAAVAEANRCLFCHDAPCINACPTHIDIPQFIRKIATENVHGSAKTIFESNILGMSCARVCPVEVLCVGACVYNDLHQPPIAIGKLQRYATDEAYAQGWRFFEAGERIVPYAGSHPAMAKLGKFYRDNGLFTVLQWSMVMCNPPLCINEAQMAEGFDIIDRGLDIVDEAFEG